MLKDQPDIATNQLFEVCNCKNNHVCHLCPESKKRRLLSKIQGNDPNHYIVLARKKPNVPTNREAKAMRRDIHWGLQKRLGRTVSRRELQEFIDAKTKQVKERAYGDKQ